VQNGDAGCRPQGSKGGLEFQSFVEGGLHEILVQLLAEWAQRTPSEAAPEPLNAGEPNALDLDVAAVQDMNTTLGELLRENVLAPRLIVVVPQNGDDRHVDALELTNEPLDLFDLAVRREIAAKHQDLRISANIAENGAEATFASSIEVDISNRRNPYLTLAVSHPILSAVRNPVFPPSRRWHRRRFCQ
jgi:hypothetical protein